ncbi:glycoside hydrolase family 9 protein [Cytophaga aurantiaca]|uniref:glycoside hydrolase family 9 protein n=1 Tax=Cytophaga aurantiaca TaxID=29530 RepID=UPI0003A1E733|nr:glycoside hydrolase family 9 protein [Cytophaga aurantiaca]
MKKVGLIITILLSSILSMAQTGVGDDFESATAPGLTTGWTENKPLYAVQTIETTAPTNTQLYTKYTITATNYSGFAYAFSSINMADAPFVTVKIKTGASFTLRIDLIDANERRTNQINTTQVIKNDNTKYYDYLFDFTGRFYQQYGTNNGPVDATQIKRVEFIITAPSTGTFLMDSVMVGTRAKTNITSGAKGIKLNQLGFLKEGPKKAVVNGGNAGDFYIVTDDLSDTVYTGTLSAAKTWSYSSESVRIADFSNFKVPGKYRMRVPGVPSPSYPFIISETTLNGISKGSIKGFYYQRASMALTAPYAGTWARAAGHPDNQVLIHNSAASPGRATGSKISSPRGWYDAGDYNKYIVNSGISTYTLLASYEHFGTYYDTLKLNIPESSNSIPDVLDEALYNVRWMLTMQDPYDGGVYHKLTNANFDGDVMPNAATLPRYVVQKATGATLDFAAVMAQSARIFAQFSTQLPGLSDSCIVAAKKAYDWAILNPSIFYNQDVLANPAITTGGYGDYSFADEKSWAAAELYTTTRLTQYYSDINLSSGADLPGWQNVNTLGLITLAHNSGNLSAPSDLNTVKNKIIALADGYKNEALTTSAYAVAMGANSGNFGWGSNSVAANQAFILIQAFNYTKDSSYLKAAVSNVDYLLGRNGINYSFVTGYGSLASNNPHHRVSQADGIAAAVPGLLVGGPNPGQQDNCPGYPSSQAALSYVDTDCSYSTNEIAINWNAPLAYITGAVQSIYSGIEPTAKDNIVDIPTSTRSAVMQNITIKLYPNPTSYLLNVEKPFDLIEAPVVLDLNGLEYTISGDWSGNTIQINTASLQAGMYLIRLQGENGAAVQKFTVTK